MPVTMGSGISGTAGRVLLTAQSYKPGSAEVILVNADAVTGYKLMPGVDWGNAIWEPFFSGQRGSQGARAAGAEPQDRQLSIPLAIYAASTDAMHAAKSALEILDDELRRFGGFITWRVDGATYNQYFDVFTCSARQANYDWLYHNKHYLVVELAPLCAPYLKGDPYDIFDGFDTDTSGDYTKDADGALLTVKGGQLVPTQTGTSRWRHTGRGYAYGDVEATVKILTGSTVVNYSADVFINGDTAGAQTFFSAQLQGGNLNIAKWAAGANTWPASVGYAYAANKTYWLRIRREGRVLTANVYTSEPTPLATPAGTVSYTMSVTENWAYVSGHSGLRLAVVATGERYDDFRVEPFTYTSGASFA